MVRTSNSILEASQRIERIFSVVTLPPQPSSSRGNLFPQTQWSIISNARGEFEQDVADGLKRLAQAYWKPLYLYLRKRGESHADASDTVQGFFEFVISSEFLHYVDRDGGKFRSYFLRSLERWRSRQEERQGAKKRGGDVHHVQLEGLEEMAGRSDLHGDASPEAAYDRQWALEMVDRACAKLRESYARRQRMGWFEALRGALPGNVELRPYSELAQRLQTTEGSVRKAVHDLRQAFAECLREEIRATVLTRADAEEELRYLVSMLKS